MSRQTFATEPETARLKFGDPYLICPVFRDQSLPFLDFYDRKISRDFCDQGRDGATSATQETATTAQSNSAIFRFPRPKCIELIAKSQRRRLHLEKLLLGSAISTVVALFPPRWQNLR